MAKEGVRSFFKGAGANILRGVAGAGVLSIYDQGLFLRFGLVIRKLTFIQCKCSSSARPSRAAQDRLSLRD
jgi:hypothetical protein